MPKYVDIPKNTDKNCHYKNRQSKVCKICKQTKAKIVNHYVKTHKDHEVYISRFSPEMAEKVKQNRNLVECIGSKIEAFCYFCEFDLPMNIREWLIHYTVHTGEYMFTCQKCSEKVSGSHHCKQPCLESPILDSKTRGNLIAFMCNDCNYTQLNEENLVRHLKREHDSNGNVTYGPIVLIQLMNRNGMQTLHQRRLTSSGQKSDPNNNNDCQSNRNQNGKPENSQTNNVAGNIENLDGICEHPKSRLTPKMAQLIQSDREIRVKYHHNNQIAYICFFCKCISSKTFEDWLSHITEHTGEACSYRVKKDMKRIHGYICNDCNYVQLDKSRLIHHLRVRHRTPKDDYEKVVFIPSRSPRPSTNENPQKVVSSPRKRKATVHVHIHHHHQHQLMIHSNAAEGSECSCSPNPIERKVNRSDGNLDENKSKECVVSLEKLLLPLSVTANAKTTIEDTVDMSVPANDECSERTNVQASAGTSNTIVEHGDPATEAVDAKLSQMTKECSSKVAKTFKSSFEMSEQEVLRIVERFEEPSPPAGRRVKPWIGNDFSTKMKLSLATQYALFKCMHSMCTFATNVPKVMQQHLEHHLKFNRIIDDSEELTNAMMQIDRSTYLHCCYCDWRLRSCPKLITHIVNEHSSSIFQCQFCFYRTIEGDNILLHYERFHQDEGKSEFLVCNGERREVNDADLRSLNAKFQEMFGLFKLAGLTQYQCIHCRVGEDDRESMSVHMADVHPSKHLLVAVKCSDQFTTAEPYQIEYIGRMKKLNGPFIESNFELNCMDPSLDATIISNC